MFLIVSHILSSLECVFVTRYRAAGTADAFFLLTCLFTNSRACEVLPLYGGWEETEQSWKLKQNQSWNSNPKKLIHFFLLKSACVFRALTSCCCFFMPRVWLMDGMTLVCNLILLGIDLISRVINQRKHRIRWSSTSNFTSIGFHIKHRRPTKQRCRDLWRSTNRQI